MFKRLGRTKKLWIFWAVMYAFCAVCSFMPAEKGDPRGVLLLLLGMAFFIPPAWLIAYSVKKKRQKPLVIIRNLSIASLSLTLLMLLLNIFTVHAPELFGQIVDFILRFVSVPMFCCLKLPVIGLFGWACLLMATLNYLYAEEIKHTRHKRKHRRK